MFFAKEYKRKNVFEYFYSNNLQDYQSLTANYVKAKRPHWNNIHGTTNLIWTWASPSDITL